MLQNLGGHNPDAVFQSTGYFRPQPVQQPEATPPPVGIAAPVEGNEWEPYEAALQHDWLSPVEPAKIGKQTSRVSPSGVY